MSGADPTATAAAMMPPLQLQKNASFNLSLYPFQKDDFFEQIGMDPFRDLRNTTDDLSIKFFEGAGLPPYEDASEQSALGFPERWEMVAPQQDAAGETHSSVVIMDPHHQHHHQQLNSCGPSYHSAISANFMPAKHMEILCNSDAPPPSIRELYGNYGASMSSNTWYSKCGVKDCGCCDNPAGQAQLKRSAESKIPRIPQKQIAELLSSLRKEGGQAAAGAQKKKRKSSASAATAPTKARRSPKKCPGFEGQPASATEMMEMSYERSLSIGTKVLRALERTDKKNVSAAAGRRASRQKQRASKAKSNGAGGLPSAMEASPSVFNLSSRIYVDMELLFQQTMAVINENKKLKTKLEMMTRLSSAQMAKIDQSEEAAPK